VYRGTDRIAAPRGCKIQLTEAGCTKIFTEQMSGDDIEAAKAMLANPDISVTQIAHRLGVSPATLYRYMPAAGPRTPQTFENGRFIPRMVRSRKVSGGRRLCAETGHCLLPLSLSPRVWRDPRQPNFMEVSGVGRPRVPTLPGGRP
jgi:hypothetical protein